MRKKLRLALLLLLGVFLFYIIVVLTHGTLTDYRPEGAEPIAAATTLPDTGPIPDSAALSFLIWNVGYGGLGAESDFFYEGGSGLWAGRRMVHTPKPLVARNVAGISAALQTADADFHLLQEVDVAADRSDGINQFAQWAGELEGRNAYFATNFLVRRVPVPVLEPWRAYGAVRSGLATYARWTPTSAVRQQLPGEHGWPVRIFQLDRCAAIFRYPVANGKELVVANLHNSAYDRTGELKAQQMDFLRTFFLEEYAKGHYVVAGGDWNQCPPFFRPDGFMSKPAPKPATWQTNIAPEFMPEGWQWSYDPTVPTNRSIRTAYQPGETFVTLIDFFLVSPNVVVRKVQAIDLAFRFSDHQPVRMEVGLR